MRTTIELDDQHRAELLRIAARRGEKGFSRLVAEALDLYFAAERERQERINAALSTLGSFAGGEADRLRSAVMDLRAVPWHTE